MGKLIRNGIEYGGGNGTDIFEVTQAEYDALVQAGTLVHNALYVITDAPNLNETAKQISYDGGTATVWDKVEAVNGKAESFVYTDSTVTDFITVFSSIPNGKTVGFLMNSGTVSNCPVPYPTGIIAKWNANTAFIELTQLNGTDASYIGRIVSGVLSWRKITTTA